MTHTQELRCVTWTNDTSFNHLEHYNQWWLWHIHISNGTEYVSWCHHCIWYRHQWLLHICCPVLQFCFHALATNPTLRVSLPPTTKYTSISLTHVPLPQTGTQCKWRMAPIVTQPPQVSWWLHCLLTKLLVIPSMALAKHGEEDCTMSHVT